MKSQTMSMDSADRDRVCPWKPDRLHPVRQDESAEAIRQSLEQALIHLMKDRLGIEGRFQPGKANGETIDIASSIDGLMEPVTCRIGQEEGLWLIHRLYGADQSAFSDRKIDLNGQVVRRILNESLLLFVDAFRDAASTMGGELEARTPQRAASTKSLMSGGASGADRGETISTNPIGMRVEYLLSQQDLTHILSKYRDRTSEQQDKRLETFRAFEDRIDTTLVRMDAAFDECEVSLGKVRQWQVGDVLRLNSSPASEVRLGIEGRPLFRCELARDDGYFALRLLEPCETIEESER